MTRRWSRWLLASLMMTTAGALATGCGADPALQRQQSEVLRRTCDSLQERDGLDPVRTPPSGFMLHFIAKPPADDAGRLTKDELTAKCDTGPAKLLSKLRTGS